MRHSPRLLPVLAVALTFLVVLSSSRRAGGADAPPDDRVISLAGEWRFALDRADVGAKEGWFARDLPDRITLPGILQAQGYGDDIAVDTPWVAKLPRDMRWYLRPEFKAYTVPGNVKMPYLSQPPKHYLGVAWYQRDVDVPPAWQGERVVLTLERARWETTAYLDGKPVGSCRSLVAPHEFELGTPTPGRHRLSVRVDNRMILPYRPDGHSVSDAEGATWNGIVGRIELSATSPVYLADAQAYPDVKNKSARVKVTIGNATGRPGAGAVTAGGASAAVNWDASGGTAEVVVPLGPDAKAWSEFSPALQHLTVKLTGADADDHRDLTFGLREIRAEGDRLLLNGTTLNLRGTHDAGGFPLTGYPATDVGTWKRILSTCKEYGLNGMRFHSWCPPDAAFAAADELGFYLQPECGMWNAFGPDGKMLAVLNDETARMVKAYGNHPSFLLLAATNEPAGAYAQPLAAWDRQWRAADPRRLYADGTGRPVFPAGDNEPFASDFLICSGGRQMGRGRGPSGWFGADYQDALAGIGVPVVAHELGQWCAYPDFDVIQKFTGYLRPSNYEVMRDSAAAHGLLERNHEIARASGRFQLACYKEEIEANLRTAGFSGFELLDLHDYLGQGTALIGVLDAFWESKGYATPEEFRRFCNVTVPLARLRDRTYSTADRLTCDVELAHFGASPMAQVVPEWRVESIDGAVVAKGEWPARDVPIGKNLPLGKVDVDLSKLPAPRAYKLIVGLRGAGVENDWPFWVYPAKVDAAVPADVLVTGDWPAAEARLAAGGKVLFRPPANEPGPGDAKVATVPEFWNRAMNGGGNWFLGLWCDAKHPALAGFPTESNCDWQWVDVIRNANAIDVDALPRGLTPIVEPIDDWFRNTRFALVYECGVGPGRLMVCSIDLDADLPGARSLRRSLLDYMGGDRFRPAVAVAADDLRSHFGRARASSADAPAPPPPPEIDAPGEVPATRRAR